LPEVVISPSGPGAIEAGLMIDETGTRFVVLTFKEPGTDPVIITFTARLFQNVIATLNRTAEAAADEGNWQV